MASRLCPYCMRMTEGKTCHHCGKNTDYSGKPMHLPAGYVVSGKHPYVLGAALGQGGFGITYIALDMITGQRVAIKEYYPTYCSARTDGSNVTAYSNQEEVYLKGKERFLDEARTLKSLSDLKSIVDVLDFFEANNSAYLVMEYLDGHSLKEHAAKNGKFPAQTFLNQIRPLMEDIHRMHERGVIHRDIAPDNIILLPDGQLKLIDFGAARSYVGDKSMTVVVKKGFAPVEQYMSKGSSSSTDVYALAATIYYSITGRVPPDSAERQYDAAPLDAPSMLGADITSPQEKALFNALQILPKDRTQSVQEFLTDLSVKEPKQKTEETKQKPERPKGKPEKPDPPKKEPAKGKSAAPTPTPDKKLPAILAAAAVLILAIGFFLFSITREQPAVQPESKPAVQLESKPAVQAQDETLPQPTDALPDLPVSGDPADRITEKVSLTVLAAEYSSQTDRWWNNFEEDFEAQYPQVDLVVDVCSWNDVYTVVNTRIANGQAPDILNIDVFADYQADGLLLPVQKYMSEETYAKFYPQFLEQSSVDGKVWAVPDLASARAMYYNVDILNAAGVEVPTTWEELEDACEAIKAYDPRIYPWGVDMTTDEGQACFAYYTLNNGGGFVDENGQWILNSPENVEAVKFITSMVNKGLTNVDPTTDTRYALQDMFASGKVAMMIGPNQIPSYCESTGTVWGVAPIPVNEGKAPSTIAVMDRFMCFDNGYSASELAAVTCFFDFFFEDERYSGWTTMEGFLPATSTGNRLLASEDPSMAAWNEILASATFYPAAKRDWADVKQGVIGVMQETLLGGNPKTLLDTLQQVLAG